MVSRAELEQYLWDEGKSLMGEDVHTALNFFKLLHKSIREREYDKREKQHIKNYNATVVKQSEQVSNS